MKNKIGIVGGFYHGKTTFNQDFKDKGIDVVVVDELNSHTQDETFELNGVKYAPIKTEQRKHKHVSSKINGIMAMASMIMNDLYAYGESRYERKLPKGTDIVKEYGLIELKQSKLSKFERDMVVKIFNKNFYKVTI